MINLEYTSLLGQIIDFNLPDRNESAAFLMWYLYHYYRLDVGEAIDHICDQPNDKGIDGIYVNEANGTIDVFQSKITQKNGRTIGDRGLREFSGTLNQFDSTESIQNIVDASPGRQVSSLINRLDIMSLLQSYTVREVFVANMELDANGEQFLNSVGNIEFVGRDRLESTYIADEKILPDRSNATFDISDVQILEYTVDAATKAIIAPIKATDLIAIEGISDQSVFAYNVRGPLGNTKINREIGRTIKDKSFHKQFPLFHNGITIVSNEASVNLSDGSINLDTFFVVNGCQSLTALYANRSSLTDDLRILTKIVSVDVQSDLSKTITRFSNNQNGVKARDFKSNNALQIRLQNEFNDIYGQDYYLEIQRGEDTKGKVAISNEQAGVLLLGFDLKEPWNSRRRYQVFDDKYNDIFARPEVNADRILMVHLIEYVIKDNVSEINNELVAKYDMTRYKILYIIRKIMEQEDWGQAVLQDPRAYVQGQLNRKAFV